MTDTLKSIESSKSPVEQFCEKIAALKNPKWVAEQSAPGSLCAIQNTPLAPVNSATQPTKTPDQSNSQGFKKPDSLNINPDHLTKIGDYLKNKGATLADSQLWLNGGAILRAAPGTQIVIDGRKEGGAYPLPEWATLSPGLSNRQTGELKDIIMTLKDGKKMYVEVQNTPTPGKKVENSNRINAVETDNFLANYTGAPGDFMNTKAYKPQFDALIQNWDTVSDASVAKFKSLLVEYAKSQGVTIPSNCWLTPTTKEWHPALWTTIGDKKITIYNAGAI